MILAWDDLSDVPIKKARVNLISSIKIRDVLYSSNVGI